MSFGKNLKEARIKKGFTQEQLAEILCVNQITISTWERGTREPSIEMIRTIAITLDCDVNYLFNFEPK